MKKIWAAHRIVFIYLILGGLWIGFSDRVIILLTQNPYQLTILQSFKGWGFILVTSFLLFLLLKDDLSKRKKMINDLRNAKEAAEKADRVKSAFLSNMSHELRTPMNAILGFTELLRQSNLSEEEKKEFLEIIQNAGYQLVDLITNIVDASTLQVHQAEVVKSSFSLNDLMDELLLEGESILANFRNHHTEIRLSKPLKRVDSFIITDYGKLSRILYHLIQNAIRNTLEGHVAFGYELSDQALIRFFVKDTGVGIPEYEHPQIFEAFVKSHEKHESTRGAGLGLNIVKGFVDLLDGEMQFCSKPDQGTVVMITLPLARDNTRNSMG